MGRGRQKAKNTRIARDLKYSTPTTDLSALQQELSGVISDAKKPDEDNFYDEYEARYADYDDEEDED